jgi:hypothetical protein
MARVPTMAFPLVGISSRKLATIALPTAFTLTRLRMSFLIV